MWRRKWREHLVALEARGFQHSGEFSHKICHRQNMPACWNKRNGKCLTGKICPWHTASIFVILRPLGYLHSSDARGWLQLQCMRLLCLCVFSSSFQGPLYPKRAARPEMHLDYYTFLKLASMSLFHRNWQTQLSAEWISVTNHLSIHQAYCEHMN